MALLGCYLIGSLDFAVVVSRAHGVDIHGDRRGDPVPLPDLPSSLGRGQATMAFPGNALNGLVAAAVGFLHALRDGAAHWRKGR